MAIWHPDSGESYGKYLQTNSFVRDITGEIKTAGKTVASKISEQTKQIVASNEDLAHNFGSGFDAVNGTLHWGFNTITYKLKDVEASIESLHADFNYGMGLLLAQAQTTNRLLSSLIDKLDEIHKTLESPLLTQARELYRIGCERLRRKLLDKALDAFLEAEIKNDTDFFTQFQIGNLYLFGIDEDDNVVDLEKAKHHLLLAARYAKSEMTIDTSFSEFAAEALLKASMVIYFQLGEEQINTDKTREFLNEAKKLASEAIQIYPQLTESFYHLAKYCALLGEQELSISNLEKAILSDEHYAVKCDIDRAFDSVRNEVFNLIILLKKDKELESQNKLDQANKLIRETIWLHEESPFSYLIDGTNLSNYKRILSDAVEFHHNKTYFSFFRSIDRSEFIIEYYPSTVSEQIKSIKSQIDKYLIHSKSIIREKGRYSEKVDIGINELSELLSEAERHLSKASYKVAFSIAKSADAKANELEQIMDKEAQRKTLQKRRNKYSKQYARRGAVIGFFIVGISGCFSCVFGSSDFSDFISVTILGIIVFAAGGAIIGQRKS